MYLKASLPHRQLYINAAAIGPYTWPTAKFLFVNAGDSGLLCFYFRLTMSELICNFECSEHPLHIPTWALNYILSQPLRDVLHNAATRTETDVIPPDAEFCALRHLDIRRILRRRWIDEDHDAYHLILLSLYLDRHGSVIPFIMIEGTYTATLTEPVGARTCFLEAQWPQRVREMIICSICTMFVIDYESGKRLHLRRHRSNVRLSSTFMAHIRLELLVMCLQVGHITALGCSYTIKADLRKPHRIAMKIAYGTRII